MTANDVSLWAWALTVLAVVVLIAADFFTVSKTPHEVGVAEAARWSIFYVVLAVVFGGGVWYFMGPAAGTEFYAAYLVEKSLSVDNLFVFAIIFTQFAVPAQLQQRVLLLGIVLALIMRAIFIALGAAALAAFSFTFVIFGALLIWTGIQLARHHNEDPNPSENFAVRAIRKRFPFTDEYHGTAMFIRRNGSRVATPMLLVVLAIGSTDLLFALDSIPATFGVTQNPYLVFTANAFALFGLRALYFLLKGLLDRLVYLSLGLAAILGFIGIKLVLTWAHETWDSIPKIPTIASLAVIAVILTIATVASLVKSRNDPTLRAHAGTLTAPEPESQQ